MSDRPEAPLEQQRAWDAAATSAIRAREERWEKARARAYQQRREIAAEPGGREPCTDPDCRHELCMPRKRMFGVVPPEQILERAEREPNLYRVVDGVPYMRRTCRGCKTEVLISLENGLAVGVIQFLRSITCDACGDKEREAAERSASARDRSKWIAASGIPQGLREATMDTLWVEGRDADETEKRRRAIERAQEWAKEPDPERGLFLYGDAGGGKTWLAAAAANARLEHSPIRWVSVAVLIAQLDAAWADDERKQAVKILTEPGAVVLDDFGKAAPTQRARMALFTALDRRYTSKTTMIVTSNHGLQQLEKDWGDPLVSRIVGICGQPMKYPGPDRRIELAKGDGAS